MSNYHYFASTAFDWVCGNTILETLEKLIRVSKAHTFYKDKEGNDLKRPRKAKLGKDMDYGLYYVPLPIEANYSIDNYKPEIDGAVLIEHSGNVYIGDNKTVNPFSYFYDNDGSEAGGA